MHIFCYFFITWTIKVFAAISCPFSEYKYSRYPSATFSFLFINDFIYNRYWWFCKYTNRRVTISNLSFPSSFGIITLHFPMRLIRHQFLFQQMLSLLRALLNLILLRFINLANKLFRLIFTIIIFFSAYPHANSSNVPRLMFWVWCNDRHTFFVKSSQSLIPFGFPFRTRNTIVDVYGVELFASRFCQSSANCFSY